MTAVPGRRSGSWAARLLAVSALVALVPIVSSAPAGAQPTCRAGGEPVVLSGAATPSQARTYLLLPVEVEEGTTRMEVGYRWEGDDSVVDLGLWDEDGPRVPEGFRGWSGSREGRLHEGEDPVWVQADSAERGYLPGPVGAGEWHVELGLALVGPSGVEWEVEVRCLAPEVGPPFEADHVDPDLVVDPDPGWYHADFHMHGYHSSSSGPSWDRFATYAEDAGLDAAPVTDYVTTQSWRELGETQRAHPELLLWPGREIITYFGHVIVVGETPGLVEYRHGFEDVRLGDLIRRAREAGALVSVAHPTTFEPPLDDLCRGCWFSLRDEIDWDLVDAIEVLNSERLLADAVPELAGEAPPGAPQPFIATAVDLWEDLLLRGHRITAVSGSDDKEGPGLGASSTAVFARELSQAAMSEGVRSGHALVRLEGALDSPFVTMDVVSADGTTAMMGDAVAAERATVTIRVTGGEGERLRISRDGEVVEELPVDADPFVHEMEATTAAGSGPLGTFWRVDTVDPVGGAPTTIGNPVFVGAPVDRTGVPTPAAGDGETGGVVEQVLPEDGWPTYGSVIAGLLLSGSVAALAISLWRRRRNT